MKKFTFLAGIFLFMMIFFVQNVSAEKNDWSDKSFNFKAVKKILVLNLEVPNGVGAGSEIFLRKLSDKYFESTKKLKIQVIDEDMAKKILSAEKNIDFNSMNKKAAQDFLIQNISAIADAWTSCKIKVWKDDYYIIPERTIWEERRQTRRIRDWEGNWIEEDYYITVPVTYPPRRVDISYLTTEFEVHDAKAGKMIFGRQDVRDREDAEAQLGMFGRMSNSFFSDLAKLIRK